MGKIVECKWVYNFKSNIIGKIESYKVVPPNDSVQLVQITPITMVYGTQITIVFMGVINQFITRGHHIVCNGDIIGISRTYIMEYKWNINRIIY